MTQDNKFSIPDRLQSPLEQRLKSWESLLMLVAITEYEPGERPYILSLVEPFDHKKFEFVIGELSTIE